MRLSRWLPAVLALVGLVFPAAWAGTEADPEISDAEGDVSWDGDRAAPSPFAQAAALDVVKSWFHDENGTHIQVTMVVADLSRVDEFAAGEGSYARWGTRFELSNYVPDTRDNWWNYTWIVSVHLNSGPPGWRAAVESPDRGGERGESIPVDFVQDLDGNRFTVIVPREALGSPMAGDRMSDPISLHDGDVARVVAARLHHNDQSPTGEGRDYVFQMDTWLNGTSTSSQAPSGQPQEAPELPVGLAFLAALLGAAVRRRR